ncbi:MAG: putative transport system ATP-binding protein [Gaiellaceae bacterium]|jgi:putative ABC transport system ATP-binding protein|nr:putative transport system ATP-binding protein [Gaiellaceae bacterium]
MTVTELNRQPIYALEDVDRVYGQGAGEVHAVRDLALEIDRGEFVVVVGPSGSGKTTLLQLLGALDRPTTGKVEFEGRDLARMPDAELTELRLRTIGFIFQQFNLIPTLTAAQNVEVALAPTGMDSDARRLRAHELLESVGLGSRATHLPSELSGGEQQRVAIARALANEPDVLLADEPTGNLDTATGEEIMALLKGLSVDGGQTVILITHDVAIAAQAARVIRMQDGRLLAAAPDATQQEARS